MARRIRSLFGLLKSEEYADDQHNLLERREFLNQQLRAKFVIRYWDKVNINRDKLLRFRTTCMFFNSIVSIALMMLVLEIEFDSTLLKLESSDLSDVIKVLINLLSIIHIFQICEYYNQLVLFERESASSTAIKVKAKPTNNITINGEEMPKPVPKKKTQFASFTTVLRTSTLLRSFIIEILIVIPQPIPWTGTSFDKALGLLMFVRMFNLFRVLRDYSTIYRKRKDIERAPGYSHITHPTFNTFLTLKMYFYQHPILFVVAWMVGWAFVLGYCLLAFEREAPRLDPAYFTTYLPINSYWLCIYLMVNCMLLGWGSDTFDSYNPYTWIGRGFCVLAVIGGVFLFALLIDYVHSKMQPTAFQTTALQWVVLSNVEERERVAATRLIQLVWRRYRWKKRATELQLDKRTKKSNKEEFIVAYSRQLKECRRARREKGKVIRQYGLEIRKKQTKEELIKKYVDAAAEDVKKSLREEMSELKQLILEMKRDQIKETKQEILQ